MLHGATCNATSISNIILVPKKLGTGKFEGETGKPLLTVILGLENFPLARKQILSFFKEFALISRRRQAYLLYFLFKARI